MNTATPIHQPLLVAALILSWAVAGANPSGQRSDDESAPLPDNERRQITTDLVNWYPDLASSPGIKFAEAPVVREDKISIMVYFHPHADSQGIKEAYRASCAWDKTSQEWSCYDAVIRRYVTLPSQEFEVRVNGDIAADAVLALIEGSRRDLESHQPNDPDRPDTVILIAPSGEGYLIAWGTDDGYTEIGMHVQLSEGGDPTNPDDWLASIN